MKTQDSTKLIASHAQTQDNFCPNTSSSNIFPTPSTLVVPTFSTRSALDVRSYFRGEIRVLNVRYV